MMLSLYHISGLITIKLIVSNLFNYSTMLNKLYSMYNGQVLLNDTAINDPVVINVLNRLSNEDNFQFKPINNTSYNISDRD